jgi:hypothetical protein
LEQGVENVLLRIQSRAFVIVSLAILVAFVVVQSNHLSVIYADTAQKSTPTPTCDPAKSRCKFTLLPQPQEGKFDQVTIQKIDLASYPTVPTIDDHVLAIYQEGVSKGNNLQVFSKVGDCMTATEDFMKTYAGTNYDLGIYSSLAATIKYFEGVPARGPKAVAPDNYDSFANPGLAAVSGFNAATVQDPVLADPKVCTGNESSLTCEYRVSKPGISLIMFGTNDIKSIEAKDYDLYLRRVVVETINDGIIPVVSTFPTQPGLEDRSILYNQVTVQVALDYDIPLINLWVALKPLPNQGIDPAITTHMTKPADGNAGNLTTDDLQFGFNVRNLLTLQTLTAVLQKINPALATPAATTAS